MTGWYQKDAVKEEKWSVRKIRLQQAEYARQGDETPE